MSAACALGKPGLGGETGGALTPHPPVLRFGPPGCLQVGQRIPRVLTASRKVTAEFLQHRPCAGGAPGVGGGAAGEDGGPRPGWGLQRSSGQFSHPTQPPLPTRDSEATRCAVLHPHRLGVAVTHWPQGHPAPRPQPQPWPHSQ